MKLNLGCSFNKLDDYINVDFKDIFEPDELVDLEKFPWPWEDDSIHEIRAVHILEHLGQTSNDFIQIIQEMYRVSQNNSFIQIITPHFWHENFYHDPTHVRAITPITMAMFDQKRNFDDMKNGGQESKLGLMYDVDFEIINVTQILADKWRAKIDNKIVTQGYINQVFDEKVNICKEYQMELKVIKPARKEILFNI